MKAYYQSLGLRLSRNSAKTVLFGLVLGLAVTAMSFTITKPAVHKAAVHAPAKKFAKQVWLQYYDPNLGAVTLQALQRGNGGNVNGTDCGLAGTASGTFTVNSFGDADINVTVTYSGSNYHYTGQASLSDTSPCGPSPAAR